MFIGQLIFLDYCQSFATMSVMFYVKLKFFVGIQFFDDFFFVVLMNKKCVKKCNSSPGITVSVG